MYLLMYLVFVLVHALAFVLVNEPVLYLMRLFWYLSRFSGMSLSKGLLCPCQAIFSACKTSLSEMSGVNCESRVM